MMSRTGLASGSSPELREAARRLAVTTAQWLAVTTAQRLAVTNRPDLRLAKQRLAEGRCQEIDVPRLMFQINPMIRDVFLEVLQVCGHSDYI